MFLIHYRGPRQAAQSRNKGILSLDLAFAKDILGDNGTLSLNVNDLLNSRKRKSFTQTAFFTSESEFQWRERQITLSLVYRINQKKGKNENQRQNSEEEEGGY